MVLILVSSTTSSSFAIFISIMICHAPTTNQKLCSHYRITVVLHSIILSQHLWIPMMLRNGWMIGPHLSGLFAPSWPLDPTADAEDNIDNLKMQDNQRILNYNVEFNRLAV